MTELLTTVESVGLADLVARATLALSVALTLQWLIRRGPAATRHHLWTVTFALLLLLPALRLFGPSWEVPLLPPASVSEEPRLETLESGASIALAVGTPVSWPAGGSETPGTSRETPETRHLVQLAFVLWGIGCGAALVSVVVGIRRFHRLVRAGRPVEDEAWLDQLDALRKQLSVRAEVRLVMGADSVTPMTGGIRRPVILIPAVAVHWSESRRHIVLAHELVHVRRRDALRQLLGRAVLSLCWFHPLNWVASRLAATRREEACDEEVLAAGARPSDYARHLLSLAESGFLRRPALSLPVAGVSVSVATPTRPGAAPGVVGEDAGVEASALHCVPASDANELSGWDFAAGLGPVLVCTIQGEAVPTISDGVRAIEPFVRAAVEN